LWWWSVAGQDTVIDNPNSPSVATETINEACSASDETCAAAALAGGVDVVSVKDFPLCADDGDETECAAWAESGECENNKGYMRLHCRKSCNLCEE
jgi:hypothetical protein